jgi:hypothetical protein
MATMQLFTAADLAVFILSIVLFQRLPTRLLSKRRDAGSQKAASPDLEASFTEPARRLRAELLAALPDSVVMPKNAGRFGESVKQN